MNCQHCAEVLPSHAKFCLACGLPTLASRKSPLTGEKSPVHSHTSVPQNNASQETKNEVVPQQDAEKSIQQETVKESEVSNQSLTYAQPGKSRALVNGGTESWSADGTEYRLETPNRKEYEYRSPDGKRYIHEVSARGDNSEAYMYESRQSFTQDDEKDSSVVRKVLEREIDTRMKKMKRDLDKTLSKHFAKRNLPIAFGRPLMLSDSFPLVGSKRKYFDGDIWDDMWSDFDRSFDLFHNGWSSRMETILENMENALSDFELNRKPRLSAPLNQQEQQTNQQKASN